MLYTALKFVQTSLTEFLAVREGLPNTNNTVSLKNLVNRDGTPSIQNEASVFLTLVQLEEDRTEAKVRVYQTTPDGKTKVFPAQVKVNAYVLFSAVKPDYETALRDISTVILYFQKNPIFTPVEFPNLNEGSDINKPWTRIEELSFHIHTLTFEQHSYIWSVLGAKYVPSVLYKMRMVTFFDRETDRESTPIEEIDYPIFSNQ